MVNEGIVLGHKISERGIEVDKAKVDAIEKMPCPKDIKGIHSFLGHAGPGNLDLEKLRQATYFGQLQIS